MIDVAMKRGDKVLAKTRSSEASYDFYLPRNKFLSPRTVGAKGGELDSRLYTWLTASP